MFLLKVDGCHDSALKYPYWRGHLQRDLINGLAVSDISRAGPNGSKKSLSATPAERSELSICEDVVGALGEGLGGKRSAASGCGCFPSQERVKL